MKYEVWQALSEGKVVCEGTYMQCVKAVGCYNPEIGWHVPEWKDAAVVCK